MTHPIRSNIKARDNTAKRLVVEAGFLALGRALKSTTHIDDTVMHEMNSWPENYSFEMRVMPKGPKIKLIKQDGHFVTNKSTKEANLVVELKNLEMAFQMITTQAGIPQVYAAHGIGVIGDVAMSMSLIRMINVVEAYLFPEFLSKNILKRVPKMTFSKQLKRMRILTIGLITGR